jgi:hypothetical protein
MHDFTRTIGTIIVALIIITLVLLLATTGGSAQACQAQPAPTRATSFSAGGEEPAEDGALICLMLVVGTALLAGVAWAKRIRWLLQ